MKHKTAKANVKTKTRLFSLLLAVLMMLFCFPVTALGTDGIEGPISETLEETADAGLSAFERGVGELSPEALESMTLNAADVPDVISAQAIAEKDHVLRLREQEENLNTVVFQNRDGGKTVYLYANPVKYVDANGNVKDKSTALKAENITLNGKTYSHSATENVFGQYYPTMPQNGVLITFGQYTVEMTPVITGILTLRDTAVANNKVTYNKVFGNGTSLVYTPTLSGVKEDIILQTYMGKSSFSFTLKTNGLAIVQTESDTFLADFEGNKVASLGKVIITDKVGKTVYGTMTVIAVAEREEYTVTINAPTAFLTSATTVYPVTVDPTFVINETYESGLDDYGNAQYSTAIEDLCVYDGTANPVYDDIATIGSYSGNDKSAMLYRIKADAWSGMNLDAYVNNIRFGSASLNVEVDSLYSKIGVSVSPFYGSWNNGTSQNVESMFIDYQFDSNSNRTTINNNTNNTASINVTNIFKYWINNPNSVNYGMILYVDNTILSGTYQNSFNVYQLEESSSSVYISIEYSSFNGSYYINSLESGKFLTGSSVASVSQGIYNGPTYQGWTFTYQGANKYIISLTANTNRVLCVDDNFCIAIGSKSSMEESFYTWQLSFYEDTVTMYNIGSGEYLVPSGTNVIGSSMDDFYGHWRVCRTNAFVPLESVTIADIVMEVGETATPTITPTPANATWVGINDIVLTINDSLGNISLNSNTNEIEAIFHGTISIKATCKLYPSEIIEETFTISINNGWKQYNSPTIFTRVQWGATEKIEDRLVPRTRAPEKIIFHHSAEKFNSTDTSKIIQEIKRIQDLHMNDNNKCDIAYHFIIDPSGNIWQGALVDEYQRGHTPNCFDDIGVLILGDFEARPVNLWTPDTLNQQQKNAMEILSKWLCYQYDLSIPTDKTSPISTHRIEYSETVCPGQNAAVWIENNLKSTIYTWYNN